MKTNAGTAGSIPPGSVSENARSSAGSPSNELSIVKTSIDVLPGPIVSGVKALVKGGTVCVLALYTGMIAAMVTMKRPTNAEAYVSGVPPLFANKRITTPMLSEIYPSSPPLSQSGMTPGGVVT